MEFKRTKGKWKEIDGILYDENGYIVPNKGNFFATSGTEEFFKDNPEYVKAKYNDRIKEKAPEMLEMLQMNVDRLELTQMQFYDKYGFNVCDLFSKTKELVTKSTEITN